MAAAAAGGREAGRQRFMEKKHQQHSFVACRLWGSREEQMVNIDELHRFSVISGSFSFCARPAQVHHHDQLALALSRIFLYHLKPPQRGGIPHEISEYS